MNVKEEVDKIELKEKILKSVNKSIAINKDKIIELMKEKLGFDYAEEKKKDPDLPAKFKSLGKQDVINLLRKIAKEQGII